MVRILLSSPHMSKEGYEQIYVNDAFDKNWIAPLGENVDKFETELVKLVGVEHGVALSSGTAAIHLALKACGIQQGDRVLVQDLTFAATVNPICYEKAEPIFIDSEAHSWNMDPELLEDSIKKYQPKAVIVVHLYGVCAQIDRIKEICQRNNVALIEDAAEALGSIYKGKAAGTYGDYGIYSFNGNKIITTSGGGMLVSNNIEGIDKARYWATQAREKVQHYEHKDIGYNYRLSNICAGIGRGQLKVLEDRVQQKRKIFYSYQEAFKDISSITMINERSDERSNYWLSAILIDPETQIKPLDIIKKLADEDIESRPIWKPMHMQPIFKNYDFVGSGHSEGFYEKGLCLPSDSKMTNKEIDQVIQIIRGMF